MSTEKKVARRLRLKDNHPIMIKVMKIYDLMKELEISIEFYCHKMVVTDTSRDSTLPFISIEDVYNPNDSITEFPPTTDFQLVYDNPAYVEHERIRNEDARKLREEAEAKRKQELKEKQEREKAAAAARKKKEDLETLARLKAQYPDA